MITAQIIKDITLEFRYTNQTDWNEFIDLVFNTAASSYKVKGDIDCSTNPNYPPGAVGDIYRVTVAGKIGGALGTPVVPGDLIVCWIANPGGTQAAVGAFWTINQVGLTDVFTITGNDVDFDVVRDLTQMIGRDYLLTVNRDRVETILNTDQKLVTDRYFRSISAVGNILEATYDALLVNTYVKTVNAANGDVTEISNNDRTELIAGDSNESITGNKILSAANYTLDAGGNVTITGTMQTADPGSGAGVWKLGKNVLAGSVLDATQYIETEIDGVIVKLARIV